MNRKHSAIENKYLSQSSKPGKIQVGSNSWFEKQRAEHLAAVNRSCTLEDVINPIREDKKIAEQAKVSGVWTFTSRGSLFEDRRYNWEKERDSILEIAKERARGEWSGNKDWFDLLESHAVAEFNVRNSPLYKAMK